MKRGLFVLFLSISIMGFSQNEVQDFEPLDTSQVARDISEIKEQVDSTFFYIKATFNIITEEVKLFGLKETLRINSSIFKPFIIFFSLYFMFLIRKRR